jgi:hypothetical protein
MSEQPYEIDLVKCETDDGTDWHESQLATLTGLPKEEIRRRIPKEYWGKKRWRSRGYIDCARAMGFNCNPRFIKWDATTPWPCIMRVQTPEIKNGWWSLIYNQGIVYDVWNWPHMRELSRWQAEHPECRITSMLQIWMSVTSLLLPSER